MGINVLSVGIENRSVLRPSYYCTRCRLRQSYYCTRCRLRRRILSWTKNVYTICSFVSVQIPCKHLNTFCCSWHFSERQRRDERERGGGERGVEGRWRGDAKGGVQMDGWRIHDPGAIPYSWQLIVDLQVLLRATYSTINGSYLNVLNLNAGVVWFGDTSNKVPSLLFYWWDSLLCTLLYLLRCTLKTVYCFIT